MRTLLACVALIGACRSATESDADGGARTSTQAANASACESVATSLCERTSTPCAITKAAIERAELPQAACEESLTALRTVERLPADVRATAVAEIARQLFARSPRLGPGEADALFAAAKQTAGEAGSPGKSLSGADARLPESRGTIAHYGEGVRILVTATRIATPSATLVDVAGPTPEPASDPLVGALSPLAKASAGQDEHLDPSPNARMVVHAEIGTPWGVVTRAMTAGERAGFREFVLLTRHGAEIRELIIAFRSEPGTTGLRAVLRVEPAGMRFDDAPAADATALVALARKRHEGAPDQFVVRVLGGEAVPIERVIAALDAVRGPDCEPLAGLGDAVPPTCWFWQAVIEPALRQ